MQPSRLLLIRHAQAAGGTVDADRPLTEPGARHAAAIGAWLTGAGVVPARVLVSPARRAVQTWEQAGTALAGEPQPIVDPRIYDNTVEALLEVLRDTPEDLGTVVLVGHNPSVRELAGVLDDGDGPDAARQALDAGFPPGGVAVFDLGVPFSGIAPGTATLRDLTVPGR
jgi:phosphohistidine phosphatase